MSRIRVAVVGAGAFGKNHLRVVKASERAELVAAVDTDPDRAAAAAAEFGCQPFSDWRDLTGKIDAAVVAAPTIHHAEIGAGLMEAGIDILVEKPIAPDLPSARQLVETAHARGRILQVGHLESFNPAVIALRTIARQPLFFEIHRLSVFTQRSLDIDVVLDLMVHDLEIVLSLTGRPPEEIRAAGISILSSKVDIANVRLAFSTGCIANLTASRVSTERVRKLRLFQPDEYISIDYARQDGLVTTVSPERRIGFRPLPVVKDEPLRLQWEAFLDCVSSRSAPQVGSEQALCVLEAALAILDKIKEHAGIVARTLAGGAEPGS
ncbi:MAG: Gfo/Idh/MocA family oxidoreductase [Bryobacteraceae bacterium]|nr:Gfo/Idh/MocA family oxidoreductase [Bryobacteraceae bacterium]